MLCRRQEAADSINKNGITVFEPDQTAGHYKENVRAGVSGSFAEKVELAIVIVKGNDTDSSICENLDMIGDDTLVMTLQNGGGNDLKIAKYVPMERILIGTTRHNSVNLYKVMQGTVSLYVDHGTENEYLLGVFAAGKCFGAYNCYSTDPSPYTAVADEDTVVMEIPKDDMRSYLALNPRNAEDMIAGMSRQISLAMKHVEMLNEELTSSLT